MPKINIDEFETEPSLGDKVRVEGVVKSINEEDGVVEISYDKVYVKNKHHKHKHKHKDYDNDEDTDEVVIVSEDKNPTNLDDALAKAFPNTQ